DCKNVCTIYKPQAPDRALDRARPRCAVPRAHHLPDEVNAAVDGLQDGLARVEVQVQARRQPGLEPDAARVQVRGILVQQVEVVDVAAVVADAQLVLHVLVQHVQ